MTSLEKVFTRSLVMSLAGPVVYGRGVSYHRQGRALLQTEGGGRVRATVRGSVPYTVELWVDDGQPGWSCSCAAGEDGSFCKHGVAVTLLLDASDEDSEEGEKTAPRAVRDDPAEMLADHVAGLDRARLVELVLDAAGSDWRLRERLVAEARAARGEGPDLGSWRARIDVAFAPYDDFVTYREAAGWAGEVEETIDALEQLCDAGHPDAVALLVEHAHRRSDQAIQYVDDSDGWLSSISQRLSELHLRACTQGDPDPVELARRLADLELTSELDGFHRAATTYAGVLGQEGLAEYRRLIEPQWHELQPDSGDWSSERFTIREAMIGLALASADPDELIEVLRHDLKTPDRYLEIVRALAAAGRDEEALTWARQGLDRFAGRPWQTPPLREFLAGILRERGEPSGAVELFWEAFEQGPSLSSYRRLLEEASDQAASMKERTIQTLRSSLAASGSGQADSRMVSAAGALVEILAYEGDLDAAWQAASEHGCDQRTWLTLARAREEAHPLEAVGVYEREVFDLIDHKKNHAYRQAVDLLARIRRLARRAGTPERFDAVLGHVRTVHKAKRNLMKLLHQKGW